MNDVLLLTMLRALDAGDTETADSCVGLASDTEALGVLLAADYSEGYTQGEYGLLTEAQKSLLVKQIVTDKNGNKVTRWVRGGGTMDDAKADPSVQRAQMIRPGGGVESDLKATPKQDKADPTPKSEPNRGTKKPSELTYLPKDPKRVTIDQAARALTDLGYEVLKRLTSKGTMSVRTPQGDESEMTPEQVKRVIYGKVKEGVEYGDGWADEEEYEDDEYQLLTEAERVGMVKKTGTDSRGRKYTRWVRATPKESPRQQGAALRAESKEAARQMIDSGIQGPAQARVLAGHLKNLTVEDAKELAAAHSAKLAGRLKADKVANLVAFAQGRGSAAPAPAPSGSGMRPEDEIATLRGELRAARAAASDRPVAPEDAKEFTRNVARRLVGAWQEASDKGNAVAANALETALANLGAIDQIGDPDEVTGFDPARHQTTAAIRPGTAVVVTRPGWSLAEEAGADYIVAKAVVRPAGDPATGKPASTGPG